MALHKMHHLQEIDLIFVRIGILLQMQTCTNNNMCYGLPFYTFRALYHLTL